MIVVNDGSTDGPDEQAAATRGRVLRRRRNGGHGAALTQGIGVGGYDWIMITDADGTYPAEAIPHILSAAPGNVMVVGARTGKTVRIPLARRPAKWFLRRLASYLAGQNLPDINSGLRLMRMRKDLVQRYKHLLPSGFSFTAPTEPNSR